MVLAESCVLSVLGGLLGLGFAWLLIRVVGDPTHGQLPVFYLPSRDLSLGIALTLIFGIVTGLLPAIQAMRLRIVEALRRV
jgi:putative ABC transport system permease protein